MSDQESDSGLTSHCFHWTERGEECCDCGIIDPDGSSLWGTRTCPGKPTQENPDSLDFGDESDDVPFTNERIASELRAYICSAGEPWTGLDPTEDHGHTMCMWIGLAIQRLEGR